MGGRLQKEGYTYSHDWFELLYGRNQHDLVKQLLFNLKNFLFKKIKYKDTEISGYPVKQSDLHPTVKAMKSSTEVG